MSLQELASKIASVAPTLGAVIGGPIGGLAGTGLQLLAKAFGLPETAPVEDIAKAVEVDPEARLKILIAENEYKLRWKELELQETKAHLADVQSARDRETKQTERTGYRDWNLYLLSYILIGGFFFLTGYLMEHKLPDESSSVVFMLFGALASGFGSVIQYFFGSSKGSKDKDMLLINAEPPKK